MDTKRSRLGHFLGEAVVITASILLAFSLDAWWDRSKELDQEQQLLAAFTTEFAGVEAELARARAVHAAAIAATRTLIRTSDTQAPLPAGDSLLSLMDIFWRRTTFDPPDGVLSGALEGGQLGLIRNDSLRALLAGWRGRVEDHQKTEQLVVGYIFDRVLPWLAEHDVLPPGDGPVSLWQARAVVAARDRTFRGHLSVIGRRNVLAENDSLRSHVGVIGRLIKESLR